MLQLSEMVLKFSYFVYIVVHLWSVQLENFVRRQLDDDLEFFLFDIEGKSLMKVKVKRNVANNTNRRLKVEN